MKPIRMKPKTPKAPSRPVTRANSKEDMNPVRVYCRLKPLSDDWVDSCVQVTSSQVLSIVPPDHNQRNKSVQCTFKQVFSGESTQKEVFETVSLPLVQGLVKGESGLLFTYGVTGSGKTFTMIGKQEDPGIVPQCLNTLFNTLSDLQTTRCAVKSDRMNGFEVQCAIDAQIENRRMAKLRPQTKGSGDSSTVRYENDGTKVGGADDDSQYCIFVSYIEIYNNVVYDLLDDALGTRTLQSKIIREDWNRNMYVNGVVEQEVKTAEEAFDLLHMGQKRKRVARTALNSGSSRSHSIFSIRVVQCPLNDRGSDILQEKDSFVVSQLSLVDLAGSERTNRTQNTGNRLRETAAINNSLMNLRTCIEILRENQTGGAKRLVPYRDCRLTHLFKMFFEGNGQVRMIVCINPSEKDYDETLQVMKFAEMTQEVKLVKTEARQVDPKLVPGRKEAFDHVRKVLLDNLPPSTPSIASVNSGPMVCTVEITQPDESNKLDELIGVLEYRVTKNSAARTELFEKRDAFRKDLLELFQNNLATSSEMQSYQVQAKRERDRAQDLEQRLAKEQAEKSTFMLRSNDLDNEILKLKEMLEEKDLKLKQNEYNLEKQKLKYAAHSERLMKENEQKMKHQLEINEDREKRLRVVRDCLRSVDDNGPAKTIKTNENEESAPPPLPPKTTVRTRIHERKAPGDVWLEHRCVGPTPLSTVMQPRMRRRKSVAKLTEAKDVTHPGQNRYCLISKEQDDVGDMETVLYKGDIVPTVSGGAQVIFSDVEALKQRSPLAASPCKRPLPTAELAAKCAVGIEGHSATKITRKQ